MPLARLSLLTTIAMIAFAGNSLLCRLALTTTDIDATSFTLLRITSGAATLAVWVLLRGKAATLGGNWLSAVALLTYAAGFAVAYVNLAAATGALLLFGAVQTTMIAYGVYQGERPTVKQLGGMGLAALGLAILLSPGLEAPPVNNAILMAVAGIAWGLYSIRGQGTDNATLATAGNFIRAVPLALVLSVIMWPTAHWDNTGALYAIASGALASGAGYALWYAVLPHLRATTAATMQLSVPALTAFGGALLLSEPITLRLALACSAILGGVAIYIFNKGAAVQGSD